ncbi:MAG: GtrA family protein [Legionella sp.]|nr:GtrA family protein [Legionella sp.]
MKFFRYIMIQLFAYVIDMGSFLVMLGFFMLNPMIANILGKLAGGVFAFVAHRNITFKSNHKKDRAAQARRFFMLSLLNIPLSSMALMMLLYGVPYVVLAKFMADVSCVFLNYWINKTFVFVAQK